MRKTCITDTTYKQNRKPHTPKTTLCAVATAATIKFSRYYGCGSARIEWMFACIEITCQSFFCFISLAVYVFRFFTSTVFFFGGFLALPPAPLYSTESMLTIFSRRLQISVSLQNLISYRQCGKSHCFANGEWKKTCCTILNGWVVSSCAIEYQWVTFARVCVCACNTIIIDGLI